MKSLHRFFARLSNLAVGSRADQRWREEMEEHLALQTEENLRAGMAVAEARHSPPARMDSWPVPASPPWARRACRKSPSLPPCRLSLNPCLADRAHSLGQTRRRFQNP